MKAEVENVQRACAVVRKRRFKDEPPSVFILCLQRLHVLPDQPHWLIFAPSLRTVALVKCVVFRRYAGRSKRNPLDFLFGLFNQAGAGIMERRSCKRKKERECVTVEPYTFGSDKTHEKIAFDTDRWHQRLLQWQSVPCRITPLERNRFFGKRRKATLHLRWHSSQLCQQLLNVVLEFPSKGMKRWRKLAVVLWRKKTFLWPVRDSLGATLRWRWSWQPRGCWSAMDDHRWVSEAKVGWVVTDQRNRFIPKNGAR